MATTYVKHGDFSFDTEKIQIIDRDILTVNKKEAFWGNLVTKVPTIRGDKLTLRRHILVDYNAKAVLNEGDTPREEKIQIVSHDITTNSYGSYIAYTRQAFMNNRDSITQLAGDQLANSRLFDTEAVNREPYLGTTYTATKGASESFHDFFLHVKTRLFKNKGKAYRDGNYLAIMTPETSEAIVKEAKADSTPIAGTPEGKELLLGGYLGAYAGFNCLVCGDEAMYDTGHTKGKIIFIALDSMGRFPVLAYGVNEKNAEVIVKDLGSAGTADPTNEVGSIASRIDNIAAGLQSPELVIKAEVDVTYVAADVPEAYKMGKEPEVSPAA